MADDACGAEAQVWTESLEEIQELIAPRLPDPRASAVECASGLLSEEKRKTPGPVGLGQTQGSK